MYNTYDYSHHWTSTLENSTIFCNFRLTQCPKSHIFVCANKNVNIVSNILFKFYIYINIYI